MYVKHIKCHVDSLQKFKFERAQSKWGELIDSQGFELQFGGWNMECSNEAHIFSIWKDRLSLKTFMKNQHDKIYKFTQQNIHPTSSPTQ